jgi:isopentenyl-diphosphate delta-isomerase type 1
MSTPASAHSNLNVILVDPNDHKIGQIEKILAHQYAMLHRAFSVFLFRKRKNRIEVLLQQRSKAKYHSGGLWTNTCCSHPRPGEKILSSAKKRLKHEMGIETKLKEIGKFHYIAQFANNLVENEIDHILIGIYEEEKIPVNPEEVESYKWKEVSALKKEVKKNPKAFTPWLKQALEIALENIHLII